MRKPTLRVLAASALVVVSLAFVVVTGALQKAEDALIARRYEEAVRHLETALAEEPESQRDRVLLLLGRAKWLAGDHAGAVQAYRRLIDDHPDSGLVAKATLQQAEALAADKQFQAAAELYRGQIERLTGLPRKEEIAATYLGLADKALAAEQPDYARAVAFYDLALDLGLTAAKRASVRLLAADALLKGKSYAEAIRRLAPLVDELSIERGKLRAMLGLGRARAATGDPAGARTALRDLIALAPDSSEAADAAFEVAKSYGVPQPAANQLDRAITALEELSRRYPEHPKARVADFLIALCLRHNGRTERALGALSAFLDANADAPIPEVARARALVGDVLHAQGKRTEAIEAWREYLTRHPSDAEWERVQRAIVDAEFERALQAYDAGIERFAEARELFGAFAAAHPLDGRNPRILLLLGEMLFKEEQFDEARTAYERCVSKYPGRDESSRAQFRIGEIYEQKTFNYHKAIEAYKLVTWGAWAGQALARIALLERKHLMLKTPRTYRTGEKATFLLTSRNIESVRVRVYRLDLETWFRATHMAGGVDTLDIEVIEPDKTFDSAVRNYKKYQETEREVEIGFDEPGAYVVKTDDRELEATTLVLITDLALIAKTSRHEFFLFSQNLKEDRVEGGVRVVLSDGERIVAEGTTDDTGVWRYKGEELQNASQLRAFVVNAAGSGAGTLDLSGLGYNQGLTPKGYLFTDRPAYQPGQQVHLKGIVREVRDGLYALPAGDSEYTVRVHTPSGATVLQRDVQFTPFGSFAADLAVPQEGELGSWQVALERRGDATTTYATSFTVARYELPRLSLTSEPDERVVFRGEHIRGRFRLRYFFGEPAIGKTIEFRMALPDGGVVQGSGVTNAEGVVPFDFETTEFSEEGIARIQASVAEENVSHALVVPVVTTEFTPKLSTVRPLYLAGESFDVSVEILDRSGKPLAKRGTVRLLRREKAAGGAIAEVEVGESEFRTRAEDGEGSVSLSASRGGEYVVRVEATDRFGALVTASLQLTISGEDDEVKLRMLSDRESYRVGETVAVKVMNRGEARLALRTIQGDGVLAYEAIRLPAGESSLEVALETLHAPNFGLALALIDGRELRTAQRDFLVARDLSLVIETKSDEVAPGAEVEVEVRATDPTGRPVEAEVALSLVDASLLSLYGDSAPDMNQFFYGTRRETGFRTTSSCTWSYEGAARRVSEALLAEERRVAERLADKAREGDDSIIAADELIMGRRRAGAAGRDASRPVAGGREPATRAKNLEAGVRYEARQELQDAEQSAQVFFSQLDSKVRVQLDRNGIADALRAVEFLPAEPEAESDQPRTDFSASGGWMSSVLTDKNGKATVRFTMPDSTTAWRLTGRAVTRDTYVGDARTDLRTVLELQADVRAPLFLTANDEVSAEARVHNVSPRDLEVALALKRLVGGTETTIEETLAVAEGREAQLRFALAAGDDGEVGLELSADAGGGLKDAFERTIPILAFGVEQRIGRAGRLTEGASFRLSLPEGREYTDLRLRIEVGPEAGRDLVAAALGSGYRPVSCRRVAFTNLSVASRGIAALTVLGYLERSSTGTRADRARLDGLAKGSLVRLLAVQLQDGSFAWVGRQQSDVRTTSQALLFLAAARERGLETAAPAADRTVAWLLGRLPTLSGAERAHVAEALAAAGRVRFETLNSLHRQRTNSSLADLARLALAWQDANRPEMASELFGVIRQKLVTGAQADADRITAVALAAGALLRARADDPDAARAIEWLRAKRIGETWGTPTATAAALSALVIAGGFDRAAANQTEIDIRVNGKLLAVVPSSLRETLAGFDVPVDWLTASDNKVDLGLRGKGVVHYTASLSGFASGFRDADRRDDLVQTKRKYKPAYRRFDNKVVTPGFRIVSGRYESFENTISQLAVGERGRVETSFYVRGEGQTPYFTPLIVEEPIPAGCTVIRDSVRGRFDHVVHQPDRLVFYYRRGIRSDTIHYEVQARFEGRFRALPTKVYGAERPDLIAYGPVGSLENVARGVATTDEYRMTPDELYHFGKGLFDAGDLKAAGEHLDELVADWRLRDDVFKEVARMMLFVSIERDDDASVVRYFEELKNRYPDLVIPFDKILAVGQSYMDIGEFEAALLVFRATAEASFLKEAAVATTLEKMGEIKSSMRFLRRLLETYPDLNTMRASLYGIGQKLSLLADEIPDGAPVDDRVGRRSELRAEAVAAFREFLVMYPEDPLAEEVSFSWASTFVEAKDLEGALAVAEAALQRYPDSVLEDELLYTVGYLRFALGEPDRAFDILRRVAEEEFPLRDGSEGPSENRKHAIYLRGQIHHALDEPAAALEDYDQVIDDFTDAREAAEFFRRKALTIPEVSRFGLDEDVVLKVGYRNLEDLEVKVYRVDLMRLYLMQKSLNNIRGIKLHGIRPYVERKVELGDGRDYEDKEYELALSLDGAGAYLVVARSGDEIASGMVLRSDLEIEAQERFEAGRVRVNVERAGAFVGGVHVKVVGSGDGRLQGGDTDLRGIYVGDGLIGRATVIAKRENEYAFYRGTGIHQPELFRPAPVPQRQQTRKKAQKGKSFDAFENNLRLNDDNRARQIEWLNKEVLEKQQRGVEVYRTK